MSQSQATATATDSDPKALSTLLDRCQTICKNAADALGGLAEDKSDFLKENLGDAVQHLELVLRVLDVESGKTEEPTGFLSRLTRRKKEVAKAGGKTELPDLNICRQGFQGNSWTIPLPELIGFLAYGRKTGVLWVDSPKENFLIGLENGRLMHATSDRTPEGLRLGEILVGLGYLTRRQLERFLETTGGVESNDATLTGELLMSSGMINDEELEHALRHQVQQLFHRLIDTENAIFSFREGMQVALAYHVEQNIPQLLLESARVQDELSKDGALKAIVGEMANHPHAQASVPEDWDSWNKEMLTELQRMVLPSDKEELGSTGATGSTGTTSADADAKETTAVKNADTKNDES